MKSFYSRKNRKTVSETGTSQTNRSFWGRFRNRLILSVLALFAAAGAFSGIWLHKADYRFFPVREVVFSGNKHLSDAELKAMSGIMQGQDLLTLSAARVAERLQKSPWVRAVSIRKNYPDRLMARIFESSPFAILQMKGSTFLIDENGTTLDRLDDTVPFLPIIAGDPVRNKENFQEALSLARVVKEKGIAAERGRVEIMADRGTEAMAMIIDNLVIKVGSGDYRQKLERFFDIEKEIEKRSIPVDYVDLRFANKVVVKPVNEVIK